MRSMLLCLLFAVATNPLFAQSDSVIRNKRSTSTRVLVVPPYNDDIDIDSAIGVLEEAVVTGIQPSSPHLTSLHIERYSLGNLERKAPYNLSDALSRLPGISQLTTGNSISKPVVRGLYGNRILILLSGLRFDNQQFQDEHGLGISQIGIDRVEIIRGPGSILYGTDAIGGVINVIEEQPSPLLDGTRIDIGSRLYTGTLGTLTDIGLSHGNGSSKQWYRIRGGVESHGDYSDGSGTRVYDSRNTGYYLKAGYGFDHPHWQMNNSYNLSYNQYGFILDSIFSGITQDSRWSRNMANPHHNVLLNILSSQNTFYLGKTSTYYEDKTKGAILKVATGIQSNKRAEDEGGGEISLNMHLFSILESAKIEKHITPKILVSVNQQTTYERNTNFGKRILIPDASMFENSISGFTRYTSNKIVLEGGIGITVKNTATYLTRQLNSPGKPVQPFSTLHTGYNLLGGMSYNPSSHFNLKSNISTGLRTPNLAELSSNGLHEGTYRYELGNPNLYLEQVISGDLTLEAFGKAGSISASIYANKFSNYIYLAQTSDTVSGLFPLFRYRQQDALIWGGELLVRYFLAANLHITETFSYTRGTTTDGANLPFIPSPKNLLSLEYSHSGYARLSRISIEPEAEYTFRYTHTGPFEAENPAYLLLNLHTNARLSLKNRFYSIGLSVRNILNTTYSDPLSRLRYYGIHNQGTNLILTIRTLLSFDHKK